MGKLKLKIYGSKLFRYLYRGFNKCVLKGHEIAVERYAVLHTDRTYTIIERTFCLRCGRELDKKKLTEKLTRTEMIQRGWFIEVE